MFPCEDIILNTDNLKENKHKENSENKGPVSLHVLWV